MSGEPSSAAQHDLAASLLESERAFFGWLNRLAAAAATAAAPPPSGGGGGKHHHRDEPLLPTDAHVKLFTLVP